MKIKRKVEMNLPQLIEWAWDNPEQSKHKILAANGKYLFDSVVSFNNDKNGVRLNGTVISTDTFTVEVEEEITEDTWFSELVIRTIAGDYILQKQGSINDFKHITFNDAEAFYIPNDDLTMTLIWRDGKLVE
ncbi:hypothetical protein LDK94_06695 [Staphylococcus arlettae]|uniref:hypothetical protein n=1 Tax=Staphylococcus arlettae TaxID=29378 RepID=UPI001E381EBC|nr:hypothetical protein [Staphylococcus arlettae]MCD9055023.1 hypothetical protein [Staphylococcus arlettae]